MFLSCLSGSHEHFDLALGRGFFLSCLSGSHVDPISADYLIVKEKLAYPASTPKNLALLQSQ